MDIYSYFYNHLQNANCQRCECNADYIKDEKTIRARLNVSICGDSSIDVNAYDTEGNHIYYSDIIDINCQPENCPFSNPSDPECYS